MIEELEDVSTPDINLVRRRILSPSRLQYRERQPPAELMRDTQMPTIMEDKTSLRPTYLYCGPRIPYYLHGCAVRKVKRSWENSDRGALRKKDVQTRARRVLGVTAELVLASTESAPAHAAPEDTTRPCPADVEEWTSKANKRASIFSHVSSGPSQITSPLCSLKDTMQWSSLVDTFCTARMPPSAACPPTTPNRKLLLALSTLVASISLFTIAVSMTDAIIRKASLTRLRQISATVHHRTHAVIKPITLTSVGPTTYKATLLRARTRVAAALSHSIDFILRISASTVTSLSAGHITCEAASLRAFTSVATASTDPFNYASS
ncbi:uncharacterized protein MYCGRDRAFT_97836 [Zymoseptoria tritici IPO323]|uniref:Uncharacterized protein n=1 Tax=Zymoseptoria tritici (strain CBS 115943 / IPO323) TaxID=336722 RepID=F9XRI9_ZYMTI|nr:uncharacterized protein MYCGRDRAFT_97836 [Zymoseptoria tritici IPO323]EGP82145.1 hypothetical protein MYCGRDRAFT_97836 [Zymoseptoria tritici IPO323]